MENNQVKLLIENIIIKSKSLIDSFKNKLGSTEERISELNHRYKEIIWNGAQRNKERKYERRIESQRGYHLGMPYI